jgi:hypothetical protein
MMHTCEGLAGTLASVRVKTFPMPDLFDSIQQQLRDRLAELRPLVAEYDRLLRAEQALTDPGRASAPPASDGTRRRGRRASSTNDRAAREANREKLLGLIAERPGISKAELMHSTRLSSATVAQQLRRLLAREAIREEPLPGGETGYRAATAGEPSG